MKQRGGGSLFCFFKGIFKKLNVDLISESCLKRLALNSVSHVTFKQPLWAFVSVWSLYACRSLLVQETTKTLVSWEVPSCAQLSVFFTSSYQICLSSVLHAVLSAFVSSVSVCFSC